jgi:hypothetical protein
VLLALWSPKGGSGTTVLAAACSIVSARSVGARLADLGGDQPAVLGLSSDPATGLADWLALGPDAPTDALDRLAVDVAPGLTLLPRGSTERVLAPVAAAEAGAALAVALRDAPVPTIVDVGTATTPAARALLEVADVSVVVVRGCYLTLRRAVGAAPLARTRGAVLVDEPGRSLGGREVADVLGMPVLARVPVRAAIARAVDAGVLASRLPDALARPTRELLRALAIGVRRQPGEAA